MDPLTLKTVTEYPLPASTQTHEIATPRPDLLLVSQQPDSALLKVRLDASGRPVAVARHVIDGAFAGLHGLALSTRHPGCVWATLQFTSQLLLLDPVGDDLDAPPRVLRRIPLPAPARGPHGVAEAGDHAWASCKDSHHVVRVAVADPADIAVHPCAPRPIFVAVHPTSGDVYATLDRSSALFRLQAGEGSTIAIPGDKGSTPVGMVPGPDGNLWFALLGDEQGGTGTFGRIRADGAVDWFTLKSGAAMGAAFIHVGFDPAAFSTPGAPERVYLLGSSMAAKMALNAVFEVGMSGGYARVETQQTIALPSQCSMSHRVLPTARGVYVTELGACAIAHLTPASSPYGAGIDEQADPYALWGCGVPLPRFAWPGAGSAL
ncbi:MAG: hypothetical protein ACK4YP_13270 [Myxococcota bacterium]